MPVEARRTTTKGIEMKTFAYIAVFVSVAVALSGCFGPTVGFAPAGYGMASDSKEYPNGPPSQWKAYCKRASYAHCGNDGIAHRGDGNSQ